MDALPLTGEKLFDAIRDNISDYICLPNPHAAVAMTLWAAFTHALSAASHAPFLAFVAPERACAKTRCLEIIGELARDGIGTSNIRPAAIYRLLSAAAAEGKPPPTLLIDEIDTHLVGDNELRGILNSGHSRRTAFVLRCVGEKHDVQSFGTWGAKALAGIGALPATIASRSIIIRMRRRLPDEHAKSLRDPDREHLATLGVALGVWVTNALPQIAAATPVMPGLADRVADNWETPLAIADCVGGSWPEAARAAALALSADGEEPESVGEMLLRDVRDIFQSSGIDCLPSSEIVNGLRVLEGRPWPEYSRGEPLTKHALANLLRPYGVKPDVHWAVGADGDKKAVRGYLKAHFADPWLRYCP